MATELTLLNRHTGERLVLRRVVPESGADFIEIEGSLPPGRMGPPPHAHLLQDEEGVVLSGVLGARLDGREVMLRAGERLHIPRGAVHTWWNAGDDVLTFRGRITPSLNFDRVLKHFFDLINSSASGTPSLIEAAYLLRVYRREYRFAAIPRPVQSILFPALVGIGTVLGRYEKYPAEELWSEPPRAEPLLRVR